MYCALKLGDICVIESLVGSLVGSAVLTVIATSVVWLFTYGKRKRANERYLAVRPTVLRMARNAFFDADYDRALEALKPLILKGDAEAQRIWDAVDVRLKDQMRASTFVKNQNLDDAMPILAELVKNGDTGSQLLFGLICIKAKSHPQFYIQGVAWLAMNDFIDYWRESYAALRESAGAGH